MGYNFNTPYTKGGAVVVSLIVAAGFYFFHFNKANSYKKEARKFLISEFEKWGKGEISQLSYLKPFDCDATPKEWSQYNSVKYKIDKISVYWVNRHRNTIYSRTRYHINAQVTLVMNDPDDQEQTYHVRYMLEPVGNGKWKIFNKR